MHARWALGIKALEQRPQLCTPGGRQRHATVNQHIGHQISRRAKHIGHAIALGQRAMAQVLQGLAGSMHDDLLGIEQSAIHIKHHGSHATPIHVLHVFSFSRASQADGFKN